MPEPYAKLIPIPTNPCYKYTSEGAGEFIFYFFIKYFIPKKNRSKVCGSLKRI